MKPTHTKPKFSSFAFSAEIANAIKDAGFEHPTAIQAQAMPAVLSGKDVLARADTGSGKTAAFVLPLLSNLSNKSLYGNSGLESRLSNTERAHGNTVQILILVPTRELAIQIGDVFAQFAKDIRPPIKCQSVFGGVKINPQMMALRGGADVLIATPGRLLDLIAQNAIKFNRLKVLVIDEVDRLMKGDFEEEIKQIRQHLPNKRQNLMFTATFPDSIRTIVRQIMRSPTIIDIDNANNNKKIGQRVITVNHNKKNALLASLLNENDWSQVLIFCSAKRTCDHLVRKLERHSIKAVATHGNKKQSERSQALSDFKSGTTRILIATDVAARGIDIGDLPCIINYDLPRSPNDYIHRIGRTGRAGQEGLAISLIAHHEYPHFKVIERHNDLDLEWEQVTGFEADKVAPPPPTSTSPKKLKKAKNKKKPSKKKRLAAKSADGEKIQQQESDKENSSAANTNVWGNSD
ncbi:MAG TPA: DEAD/DEAH box helicase [Chromatiaceae bacterium]|jgi:superfamily II DNA/RNA helicase|nr:DEAD/DEAH box helicase [Chromatiaceae bacterium]HIB83096.1 DEAD/DEAH box helicase [Chromatiaceae bacterium]HIN83204.1 DEAD/DEAH box helicase [Chromatiales bacterium]HIO14738.1 DEAD/DEAH box helicase [Chromatiales bacterium]HIO53625.1 DEAD/DEAH box helicase [Chromatiales bacterium]